MPENDGDDRERERDREFIAAFVKLRERLVDDIAHRRLETTLTLPTMIWLNLLDEIEGRNARNYSRLVRDDFLDRLEETRERLHDEITYMVAMQPGPVAGRYGEGKPKRQYASPELQDSVRRWSKPKD